MLFILIFVFSSSIEAQSLSAKAQKIEGSLFFGIGSALSQQDLTVSVGSELQTKLGLFQFRGSGVHEGIRMFPET